MGYKTYRDFTEKLHDKYLSEGRGTGECKNYIPWIQEGDVPTKMGNMERYKCPRSDRVAVLLSGVESIHRLLFDSCSIVLFVHEQVPLDREVTRRIAKKLGIEHPRDSNTRIDVVMTTDHLVYARQPDGQVAKHPRSSKSHVRPMTFNDAEHAEIERLYWLEMEVRPWKVLTDSTICIPQVLRDNLEKLKPHRTGPMHEDVPGQHAVRCREIKAALLAEDRRISIGRLCAELDVRLGFQPGVASSVFLRLVFTHAIAVRLNLVPLFNQDVQEIARLTRERDSSPESPAA